MGAAYTALVGLFPSRQAWLDASYAGSVATLHERCSPRRERSGGRRNSCEKPIESGLAWGAAVAQTVLAWRAVDGFSGSYPAYTGGTAAGQWRPTPPAFGPMSGQGLAFTEMFVLVNNTQFQPPAPRTLGSTTYADDFNAVKTLTTAVGGVDICLAKDIDDSDSHLKLSKGEHNVKGEEALAFVRTRHSPASARHR